MANFDQDHEFTKLFTEDPDSVINAADELTTQLPYSQLWEAIGDLIIPTLAGTEQRFITSCKHPESSGRGHVYDKKYLEAAGDVIDLAISTTLLMFDSAIASCGLDAQSIYAQFQNLDTKPKPMCRYNLASTSAKGLLDHPELESFTSVLGEYLSSQYGEILDTPRFDGTKTLTLRTAGVCLVALDEVLIHSNQNAN